jgi:hypothetical protein
MASAIVMFALVSVACGGGATTEAGSANAEVVSTTPTEPARPTAFGVYSAEGSTKLGRINFYDGSHYVSWKPDCVGDVCVDGGTFRVDATAGQLVLKDGGSGVETTLSFDPGGLASGCMIIAKLQSPEGTLSRTDDGSKDLHDAIAAQIELGGRPVSAGADWLTTAVADAQSRCQSQLISYPGPRKLSWNGLDLVDVPACGDSSDDAEIQRRGLINGTAANLKHAIYAADGSAVLTMQYMPGSATESERWSVVESSTGPTLRLATEGCGQATSP